MVNWFVGVGSGFNFFCWKKIIVCGRCDVEVISRKGVLLIVCFIVVVFFLVFFGKFRVIICLCGMFSDCVILVFIFVVFIVLVFVMFFVKISFDFGFLCYKWIFLFRCGRLLLIKLEFGVYCGFQV